MLHISLGSKAKSLKLNLGITEQVFQGEKKKKDSRGKLFLFLYLVCGFGCYCCCVFLKFLINSLVNLVMKEPKYRTPASESLAFWFSWHCVSLCFHGSKVVHCWRGVRSSQH